MTGFAAVVLAGGAARRMGGADKPEVLVAGRSMRDRVLAAVSDASPRIVVGPAARLPRNVLVTREEPPGSGPVAAAAAGLTLVDCSTATVALLAADLPLLTPEAVDVLRCAVKESVVDGVVFVDADRRRQMLCGMWRVKPLRAALAALAAARGGSLAGASIRRLLDGLTVGEVKWPHRGPPPWFDCDTDDEVRRAEEWMR